MSEKFDSKKNKKYQVVFEKYKDYVEDVSEDPDFKIPVNKKRKRSNVSCCLLYFDNYFVVIY